jgi:uncharacterized protein (TIGR01319 family)
MKLVSIDIGSTWTKGAVFRLLGDELTCEGRAACPTTVANLADGFFDVLGQLAGPGAESDIRDGRIRLFYSSSAKGGLAVAALGIVPEITLETAKVAAYSAGAKLSSVLSYRLTRADIRALEQTPPDILLFAGGTDGGNTDYVLANAQALAASSLDCAMVYAGNRAVRDDVVELLAGKELQVVDNLLPEVDAPNPDPAREAMRGIFLSKITKGKGLDIIVGRTGAEPLPTPYVVYEYVKYIRNHVPGWDEFILLDMGGATTDVYSAHRESPAADTVLRGLPEPDVKRTVEGDLGMRVSAESTADSGRALIAQALAQAPEQLAAFEAFVTHVTQHPETLPADAQGRVFDTLLAGACVSHACARHAGRSHQVHTADGIVNLQLGRDLRGVKRVIGSGGWLSRASDFSPSQWLSQLRLDAKGKSVLLPAQVEYARDEDYLFPLLANVARAFPAQAARAGIRALRY